MEIKANGSQPSLTKKRSRGVRWRDSQRKDRGSDVHRRPVDSQFYPPSRTKESAMPTQREIDDLKELMGKCNEEITSLWETLSPVERGWVDLPDVEVTKLRRRMSECETELERLRAELEAAYRRVNASR
jgi:hypothetical protein